MKDRGLWSRDCCRPWKTAAEETGVESLISSLPEIIIIALWALVSVTHACFPRGMNASRGKAIISGLFLLRENVSFTTVTTKIETGLYKKWFMNAIGTALQLFCSSVVEGL